MKDWDGNKNSIYKTLGASNHTEKEREINDFYATDPISIDKLLQVETPNKLIWECACGCGDLSKRLEYFGYNVKSTDLVYRDYGEGNIDFLECKENFNGDIITNPPYKCFDSITEIKTNNGWKFYNELCKNDKILSVNINSQELEWANIINVIEKDVNEELLHFKHKFLDILVTNEHRMFTYSSINNKPQIKNNDVYLAKDIKQTSYIPLRRYKWEGHKNDKFILKGCFVSNGQMDIWHPDIEIKMIYWVRFFGFWLADGCCRYTLNSKNNRRYTISIKQSINNNDIVEMILKNLPFKYKKYKNKNNTYNYEINNKQLWLYLSTIGKSKYKYIPKGIKDLDKTLLNELFKFYTFGDSTIHKGIKSDGLVLSTISKSLIEDLQEIILKLGYLVNFTIQTNKKWKNPLYVICLNINKKNRTRLFYCNKQNPVKKELYNGKVFCLNLDKNHFFILRRNNKIFISGNCATEFILKALDLIPNSNKVYMFLKIQFLEGKARKKELFDKFPPKYVYVFSERVLCAKNGDFEGMRKAGGSAVAYAWYVWEKGYNGETVIKWI